MIHHTKHAYSGVLIVVFVFLALIPRAVFCNTPISSYDRLPTGDWTYDAMAKLATDGLVPDHSARVFQGDRLFTRIEMASIVASVVEHVEEKGLTSTQSTLIDSLIAELRPELLSHFPNNADKFNSHLSLSTETQTFITGHARALAAQDSDNDSILSISAFAAAPGRMMAMATFSENRPAFFHETKATSDLGKIIVRGFGKDFSWSVGREYLNWGHTYTGSLLLSDNSGSLDQIRGSGEVDFGRLLGRMKISQFVSTFREDGQDIYLLGRRYERPLTGRWHGGVGEVAKMNKTPNPLLLVMPFYLYQHLFLNDTDASLNALYSLDLIYRTESTELYGEFMVDDISAPGFLGAGYDRPRKTGLTVGFFTPKVIPGKHLSTFRAEYTYVDRQTYEATRPEVPELAYMHDGLGLGHPIGPNATALYLRGEQYLADNLSVILEYLNQKQKDTGDPPTPSKGIFSVLLAYDITPGKSVSLRIAPYEIKEVGSTKEDGTLFELRASASF